MKKILFVALSLLCFVAITNAEDTTNVVKYPAGARYVIVNPNNNISTRTTFLLDTQTGKTWSLAEKEEGTMEWMQMVYNNLDIRNNDVSLNTVPK